MSDIAPSRMEYFCKAYDEHLWGQGSGIGSKQEHTVCYRQVLEELLRAHEVRSVLDIGCGDCQCFALIRWGGVQYTGIDIVPGLVANLNQHWGSANVHFVHGDVLAMQVLPPADLLIIKDVMQHWTDEEILGFLPTLDHYRLALVTNDVDDWQHYYRWHERWRPVDLRRPPFRRRGEILLENRTIPQSPTKITMLLRS